MSWMRAWRARVAVNRHGDRRRSPVGDDDLVGPPGVEPGCEASETSISSSSGPAACSRQDSNLRWPP